MQISPTDHDRVSTAVREAESRTSGEIVTIVADRSDSYRDVVLGWALGAVFAVLTGLASMPESWVESLRALALGWQIRVDHHELLLALAALLLTAAVLAGLLAAPWPMRMALTPRRVKIRRCRARALDYFRVGAEKRTIGRTAVLIYVSLAEHQVEIVADQAIHSRVAPESWGEAVAELVDALCEGRPGDGLANAVARVGSLLADHFPPDRSNPNELPDRLIEVGSH